MRIDNDKTIIEFVFNLFAGWIHHKTNFVTIVIIFTSSMIHEKTWIFDKSTLIPGSLKWVGSPTNQWTRECYWLSFRNKWFGILIEHFWFNFLLLTLYYEPFWFNFLLLNTFGSTLFLWALLVQLYFIEHFWFYVNPLDSVRGTRLAYGRILGQKA